jgi:hypothetical protein
MRNLVTPNRPAWHPRYKDGQVHLLTPAQVQRSALAFLLQSSTPARNTRPAGKGLGRQNGYRPTPRKRYAVIFKTKKALNQPKLVDFGFASLVKLLPNQALIFALSWPSLNSSP